MAYRGSYFPNKSLLCCLLVLHLVAGLPARAAQDTETPSRKMPAGRTNLMQALSDDFVAVAQRVAPAIVSLHTVKIFTEADTEPSLSQNGESAAPSNRDYKFSVPRLFRQRGTGSGVIISPDGYILTNYHVVAHASQIEVELSDSRSFEARVVGLDRLTEIAVIKIQGEGLPSAPLGDSDTVCVGEWVLAIGNPLDLASSVTAGIVSALGRQIDIIPDNYAVEWFIQTDAAINPGNSGGALVNARGEVIGLNTAIATETGFAMGFGFAIPINLAKKIAADLIRNGRIRRGYLGIALQNVGELQARALRMEKPEGVFVDDIFPESPALKAGLQLQDVILSIDGAPVSSTNGLQRAVAQKSPGDTIRLRVLRNNRPLEIAVTLGERETEDGNGQVRRPAQRFRNLGIEVQALTEVDRLELKYTGTDGVLVTEVARLSPAEKSGLQIDDIIVACDKTRITGPLQFVREIQSYTSGQVMILQVFRAAGTFHFFLMVP